MPSKMLYKFKDRSEVLTHPTFGIMKCLMIYNSCNGCDIGITAVYFDNDSKRHEMTSKKLNKFIAPKCFKTLIYAIDQIADRQVYALALLSLLQDDAVDKKVSVTTQTDTIIAKTITISPDSETPTKVQVVESKNFEDQDSDSIINDRTINPEKRLNTTGYMECTSYQINNELPIHEIVRIPLVKSENLENESSQTNNEMASHNILQLVGTENLENDNLQINMQNDELISLNMVNQNLLDQEKVKVTIGTQTLKTRKRKNPYIVSCSSKNPKVEEKEKNHNSKVIKKSYQVQSHGKVSVLNNNNRKNENSLETEQSSQNINPSFDSVLDEVVNDKYFTTMVLYDGSRILLPVNPKDMFHIATPNILKYLTKEEKPKLILHQAFIDWKFCLKTNEDGLTVAHLAVLNNDIDLLKRHIIVLKSRRFSIDIMARGLTPLHIAIKKDNIECTKLLLKHGADPLLCGINHRNSLHLAALATPAILNAVTIAINYSLATEPDAQAKKQEIFEATDAFGYNALMLACRESKEYNFRRIAEHCPSVIDQKMPSTGNTALLNIMSDFLANINNTAPGVLAQKQLLTICNLLKLGSNITIKNNYGLSFNHMLQKCKNVKVQMFLNNIKSSRTFTYDHFEKFWKAMTVVMSSSDSVSKPAPWYEYRKTLRDDIRTIVDDNLSVSKYFDDRYDSIINNQLSANSKLKCGLKSLYLFPSKKTRAVNKLSSLKVISESPKNNVNKMEASDIPVLQKKTIKRKLSNIDTSKPSNVDIQKRKLSNDDTTNVNVSQSNTNRLAVNSIQAGPNVNLPKTRVSSVRNIDTIKNKQSNIVKLTKADLTNVNQVWGINI